MRRERALTRHTGLGGMMRAALLVAAPGAVVAQSGAPMTIDLAQLQFDLDPDFTTWRTGEGDPAEWTLVGDPTAANGRAIAQTSKDRTDYRFPLAVYKSRSPVKIWTCRCASSRLPERLTRRAASPCGC
jgi:hypothetical protein